jgi:putative acetyltransferase
MLVRREGPEDVPAVRAVVAAAFAGDAAEPDESGEPVEVSLLDQLRADPGWLPALSLVATAGPAGEVIGHVVCTRGTVGGRAALGLGPLAVRPDRQRTGVGSALTHAVLGAADALDEPLVALLGSPDYYGRFGFRPAAEVGIAPPDPAWGGYFQVRTLSAYRPVQGTFAYAAPFGRL